MDRVWSEAELIQVLEDVRNGFYDVVEVAVRMTPHPGQPRSEPEPADIRIGSQMTVWDFLPRELFN